jgi:hypothetical protein
MERAAPCCSRPAISSTKSRRGADERDTAFQPASAHVHPTINDAFLSLNRKFCDVAVTRHVNATVRGGAHTGSVGESRHTEITHTLSLSSQQPIQPIKRDRRPQSKGPVPYQRNMVFDDTKLCNVKRRRSLHQLRDVLAIRRSLRRSAVRRDNQDETAASIRMRLGRGWPYGARA